MLLFSGIVRRERDFLIEFVPSPAYPNLATLALHGDAGGITDFDPDGAPVGLIGTVYPLGDDALGAKPTRMGEHDRPIFAISLPNRSRSRLTPKRRGAFAPRLYVGAG
jgi:hypothetical protein